MITVCDLLDAYVGRCLNTSLLQMDLSIAILPAAGL